jgi:hypothetical protein
VAIIEMPGLTDDPERIRHHRFQHIAFELRTLDELLGPYVRLKASGIVPAVFRCQPMYLSSVRETRRRHG